MTVDHYQTSIRSYGKAHPDRFVYLACYWLSDESDFNFLACFAKKEDADEYISRQVWSHLKTFVSKQPLY